ncbi:MAG: phosphatidate cytidylyltransferase [Bacteroidales bacterium]|jgi:phosphatidate cytidylyltransferase|nr:phosphatidate cytidylyltransferase [Bacteroidales bacterium]
MKEITKRILTGIIYIGVILAATCINLLVSAFLLTGISVLALLEFYKNADLLGIKTQKVTGILISFCFMTFMSYSAFLNYLYSGVYAKMLILLLSAAFVCFAFISIYELFRKTETPFSNIAYTILGVLYTSVPFGIAILQLGYNGFHPLNLLSLFIFVWCNDTFAYLVGCKWGKNRICERISPKKSWEGFAGGLIATQIAAIIIWYLTDKLPLWHWIVTGLIMTVFGTLGDLVESMFKRQVGVKDSGDILPGHGGILDRFDSMLIALPVIFIFIQLENVFMN